MLIVLGYFCNCLSLREDFVEKYVHRTDFYTVSERVEEEESVCRCVSFRSNYFVVLSPEFYGRGYESIAGGSDGGSLAM